jgi:Rrf2 family protein
MQITRQADYAVRAVLELARHPTQQRLTAEEIAGRWAIPGAFLSKTLGLLSEAGIVATQRGVKGGVRLSRSPAHITLLDVVEAVDGPIALNGCVLQPRGCRWSDSCPVHGVWCSLQQELRAQLATIDFRQLASEERAHKPTLETVAST